MSSAFGEPPDSGVSRSADAPGTAIRNVASAAARAAGSRQRVKRLGKAGGSYLRPPAPLHFVAHAPKVVRHAPSKAGSRFSTNADTPS
jgi:hypothetical protein